MRPRRWLQRRMLPFLERLDRSSALVGLHMRTGFADWQYYSSSYQSRTPGTDGSYRAGRPWHEAATAAPMPFSLHWSTFEMMLYDCKEAKWTPGNPCFNWRRPQVGQAPTALTAYKLCGAPGQVESSSY